MLTNKKIAFFMDVDNVAVEKEQFQSALYQLDQAGEVVYGKVYGLTDRKHKEIDCSVLSKGYESCPPMRVKKRGTKVFDNRIVVDIMEKVLQNNTIDTVAIFAAPADLTWLYAKLRSYGISIMALDNNDEENCALVHQLIDIGIVEKLKPLKKSPAPQQIKDVPAKAIVKSETKLAQTEKPQKAPPVKEETADIPPLMDTINKILAETEQAVSQIEETQKPLPREIKPAIKEPVTKEKPAKSQKNFEEMQVLQEVENIENSPNIIDDENAELLDKIRKLIEDYRNE